MDTFSAMQCQDVTLRGRGICGSTHDYTGMIPILCLAGVRLAVRALARTRWSEYLFGTTKNLVSGGSGSANPVLDLANPHNCTLEREDGRIVKIITNLYYEMDIDEVLGTIQLDINNGTLQGFTQQFALNA